MISNAAQSILDRRTILAQSNDAESFIAARDNARREHGIWWAEKGAFHVVRVRDMVVERKGMRA